MVIYICLAMRVKSRKMKVIAATAIVIQLLTTYINLLKSKFLDSFKPFLSSSAHLDLLDLHQTVDP